jgi:hypothetical protein
VEIACDPRSLLGRREAPFALGLPLGLTGALLEVGDTLAPEPDPVPEHPGSSPRKGAEESGDDRGLVTSRGGGNDVSDVEEEHDRGGQASAALLATPRESNEVERDHRGDRRPGRVVERGEGHGRRRRGPEDGQRRPPPRKER